MIEVTDSNVDEAINRVLLAEREAQQAVDACREQARLILDNARLQAARISARVEIDIAHNTLGRAYDLRRGIVLGGFG